VVPTGIVEVVEAINGGRARVRLVQKYEDVFSGQAVTTLEQLDMPNNVFPKRVEFGLSTHVAWIYTNPELPSRGSSLILAAGSAAGLVPGDQVSLRRPRSGDQSGALEDAEIAVAQVTRVTRWGASALIIDTNESGVGPGVRAQVSAKMP
jgi:hypothetical protein